MSKKTVVSPTETGSRGIPPGLKGGGHPKKGFVIPSETGNRGKPTKSGVTSRPAPRD